MAFTHKTTNAAKAWAPDALFFPPEDAVPDALILKLTTKGGDVEGDEPSVRVGYIEDDSAEFVDEGADFTEANPDLLEALVFTKKIGQLNKISREQFRQAQTASQLAQSVSRAITRKSNLALVAQAAPQAPAVAPSTGLINTPNIVSGDLVSGSLDALIDLVAELENNLAVPTAILLDPLGWAAFSKLKTGAAYNSSLIGAGTSEAVKRLLSLEVVVDPSVPDYQGMVIDKSVIISATGQVEIDTDESVYFASQCVGIIGSWRHGHVVVRPERIGKFTISGGGS